jgi:hypothetical protein
MDETPVQKQINVYNGTEFPYGLLSSNNISPFRMSGAERAWGYPKLVEGTWKSVTQFVYVNMFSDRNRRNQMTYSTPFGFDAMVAIQSENDKYLFIDYVKRGLHKRITGSKTLLYKLSNLGAHNIIYEEFPYIVEVLNQIRYPKNKMVYHTPNAEAIFVSLGEAASVLHGIEIEIGRGGAFADNETYINLIKWSKPAQPEPDMIDWIDLDRLVPLARLRLRNQKIIQNVEIFKNLLLDTFLDYILETEYPYLEKSLYERAKTQQLEKESAESTQSLKNLLYELFIVGGHTDVHKQILSRTVNYQPQQFILEPYPEKTNYTSTDETIDLATVPELTPSYESMDFIDGKSYLSVIHYAYDMLIHHMLKIYPGLDLDGFDINSVKTTDLSTVYADIQREWTEKTLRINNEAALEAKLQQHVDILHFLFQTDPYPILYEDLTDPILGVYNGTGKNMTGNHLMYLRETLNRTTVKNTNLHVSGASLANNNILQLWLYNTSLHLRNTLLLFDSPKTRDLEYLYSVHTSSVKQRPPNTLEQQVLEKAGLTSLQILSAWPMILVLAAQEFGDYISEIDLARGVLRRHIKKSEQYAKYNNQEDYDQAFKASKQYLSQATENIKLAPDVDVDTFVKSMLAGRRVQPDETIYTVNLENLHLWSASFAYFVVEEPTDDILEYIKNIKSTTIFPISLMAAPPVQNYKSTIKMRRGKNRGVKEVQNTPTEPISNPDPSIEPIPNPVVSIEPEFDEETIREGRLLEQMLLS